MNEFRTFDMELVDGTPATVKALIVGEAQETAPSQGLSIDDQILHVARGIQIIRPPEDPGLWAQCLEINSRLRRAVHVWARNTVGLGWRLVPKDLEGNVIDIADGANSKYRGQYEEEKRVLGLLFKFPNSTMPFTKLAYLMKYDEAATGNGYIEVVRNLAGKIVSLYHIPSIFVRVLEGDRGFVQIRGLQTAVVREDGNRISSAILTAGQTASVKFFKNFGDVRAMDATTGDFRRGVARSKRASELLPFRLYSPRSQSYGVPNFISAAPAITGNREAAERQVSFFRNDSVPRALLMVTGGQLNAGSIERVKKYFDKETKGKNNSGRLLVLEVEPKRTTLGQVSQTSMEFKPITVGITEDASFLAYRASNDEEVREVMGLSEVYFRCDTINRSAGELSMLMTEQNEFEPDRIEKEFLINHTVVADPNWGLNQGEGPGAEITQFEFRRPELLDPLAKAQVRASYAALGALTVNEIRADMGKDPYPADYFFANKPMVIALAELQAGLALAIKAGPTVGTPETPLTGAAAAGATKKELLATNEYLGFIQGIAKDLGEYRRRHDGNQELVKEIALASKE